MFSPLHSTVSPFRMRSQVKYWTGSWSAYPDFDHPCVHGESHERMAWHSVYSNLHAISAGGLGTWRMLPCLRGHCTEQMLLHTRFHHGVTIPLRNIPCPNQSHRQVSLKVTKPMGASCPQAVSAPVTACMVTLILHLARAMLWVKLTTVLDESF